MPEKMAFLVEIVVMLLFISKGITQNNNSNNKICSNSNISFCEHCNAARAAAAAVAMITTAAVMTGAAAIRVP